MSFRLKCPSPGSSAPADVQQLPFAEECCRLLGLNGFVVLDGVLPVSMIHRLESSFLESFSQDCSPEAFLLREDVFQVGNLRWMVTLPMAGPFAATCVYANQWIYPLARKALGDCMVIDSFGLVLSFPGSKQQHLHRDSTRLFKSGLDAFLPAHALTVAIPLVSMDEEHGSTAFYPQSHRQLDSATDEGSPYVPDVPVGSCLVWDFRTRHGGTPNRSTRVRPLLTFTYAREWWYDIDNYKDGKQSKILISDQDRGRVPEEHRHLFARLMGRHSSAGDHLPPG
ncbi:phytanoyl-CoA dioxygenase family protein [Synechococcus sp. CS-1324]|uniref:phytanoyl-CoA dioxygenase family protein n=1 Tax=Synechococcus sp. CS-1324 TaxID=2847980 RepID=UPI00223BB9B8|nr:phytanoyl-CoA dioxygenase family protein [Synechococcus sp. CS-1324]MCT0230007.1 phytanoyl-CoA dioxygenase family protein [Synechococcus sp. CS-1324]